MQRLAHFATAIAYPGVTFLTPPKTPWLVVPTFGFYPRTPLFLVSCPSFCPTLFYPLSQPLIAYALLIVTAFPHADKLFLYNELQGVCFLVDDGSMNSARELLKKESGADCASSAIAYGT